MAIFSGDGFCQEVVDLLKGKVIFLMGFSDLDFFAVILEQLIFDRNPREEVFSNEITGWSGVCSSIT